MSRDGKDADHNTGGPRYSLLEWSQAKNRRPKGQDWASLLVCELVFFSVLAREEGRGLHSNGISTST